MNYLGLKSDDLEKTITQLNTLLANYQIYYQNLRNYHWNITGEHFFDLHVKFEELYNEAILSITFTTYTNEYYRKRRYNKYKEYVNKVRSHSWITYVGLTAYISIIRERL